MSERWPGGIVNKTAPVPSNSTATGQASGVWNLNQIAYYVSQGLWPNPGSDPYFLYDTLLLNGNAPNGNTSTFISDASTNNFQVTPIGNPYNSVQNPFQAGYYSNYFNGSSSLSVSGTPSLTPNTGSFTLEFWLYPIADGTIFITETTGGLWVGQNGSNFTVRAYGVADQLDVAPPPLNTWTHIACVRNSSVLSIYYNGISQGSAGNSYNFQQGTIGIGTDGSGDYYTGYISNLRYSSTAIYTTSFTPPTAPLTNGTYTQLLTCQSAQFIDNSTNQYAITVGGSPKVSQNQPFTYTTPVTYGSGYFNASDPDYLATTASQVIPTGSYTLEAWVYTNSSSQTQAIFAQGTGVGDSARTTLGIETNSGPKWSAQIGSNAALSSNNVIMNAWNHVAMTFNGSTITLWVNGVSTATASSSTNASNTILQIGKNWGTYEWNGYISNARISNIVRYTTTFTPSTTPFTVDANTVFLNCQSNVPATNNGFVDSSPNQFLITRNGNTTQGSFSPYGNLWSNYFNGVGVAIKNTTAQLVGASTSTFTVECWVNLSANTVSGGSGDNPTLIAMDGIVGGSLNLSFGTISTGKIALYWNTSGGYKCTGSTTLQIGVWYHIAASVSSNSINLFVNGVQETLSGTTTLTNRSSSAGGFYVGSNSSDPYTDYNYAYVSNARVVSGTSLYSSNFTPSTTPLTAVSGTTLLACQSNRFIDNSSNNFALAINGSPSVQRFSPFNPTAPYSTTTIGGSGYFDGSSYLTTASGDNITNIGTGDFTFETWFYPFSNTNYYYLITDTSGAGLYIGFNSVGTLTIGQRSTSNDNSASYTPILNQWNYLVVVRQSGNISFYVNGTRIYNSTNTVNYSGNGTTYYYGSIGGYYNGYVSNQRFTQSAVYSASSTTITVPTAPLTTSSSPALLMNMTNAGIPDLAMQNDLQTVGSAQVSTSVVKYGTGSISFDGSTSYLQEPSNPNWDFGTGDFTVELWAYFNNVSGYTGGLIMEGTGVNGSPLAVSGWILNYYSGNLQFQKYDGSTQTQYNFSWTPSTGTWYHIAVSRSSSSLRAFINGTQIGSTQTSTDSFSRIDTTTPFWIGRWGAGGSLNNYFSGYMDDIRITKGYARYTTNFTPPGPLQTF